MRPSSDVLPLLCLTKSGIEFDKSVAEAVSESNFCIKVSKQLSLTSSAMLLESSMTALQVLCFCCAKQSSLIILNVFSSDFVSMGYFEENYNVSENLKFGSTRLACLTSE